MIIITGSKGIVYIGEKMKESLLKIDNSPKKALEMIIEDFNTLFDFLITEIELSKYPKILQNQLMRANRCARNL